MDSIYIEPENALKRQQEYLGLVQSLFNEAMRYSHPDKQAMIGNHPDNLSLKSVVELFNSVCKLWIFALSISKYELLHVKPINILSVFKYDIDHLIITPSDCYDCLNKLLPSA